MAAWWLTLGNRGGRSWRRGCSHCRAAQEGLAWEGRAPVLGPQTGLAPPKGPGAPGQKRTGHIRRTPRGPQGPYLGHKHPDGRGQERTTNRPAGTGTTAVLQGGPSPQASSACPGAWAAHGQDSWTARGPRGYVPREGTLNGSQNDIPPLVSHWEDPQGCSRASIQALLAKCGFPTGCALRSPATLAGRPRGHTGVSALLPSRKLS